MVGIGEVDDVEMGDANGVEVGKWRKVAALKKALKADPAHNQKERRTAILFRRRSNTISAKDTRLQYALASESVYSRVV